ncbi:MAG: Gfo/Idh/MocA family oxidoreductase, partial [Candidatus Omnitrophota bacterium]
VEVVAVCDKDSARLKNIENMLANIQVYTDYQKILNDNTIDAVVISTPAVTHYELTKAALVRNKHVLVEKPLALKIEQAQELIAISENVKKILMVGHTFLYNPAINKIKEIIEKEELGKIYYIHSRRTNLGPLRKDVNAIWDLSPHDISIMNYLLGQMPIEGSAYTQRFLSHDLEDVGFMILKYPQDILLHIHVSWLDPKKVRETTIIGTKKMLVYDDINANEPIRVYDKNVMKKTYDRQYTTFEEFQLIIRDGEVQIPEVKTQEPLKVECQHFIDSIINRTRPLTDGEDGLRVLKVIDAINKSIVKRGEFVKI